MICHSFVVFMAKDVETTLDTHYIMSLDWVEVFSHDKAVQINVIFIFIFQYLQEKGTRIWI